MSNKRMKRGQIVARELFLPPEDQPADLTWAAKVLSAPSPHFDDLLEAAKTIDEFARNMLPGASWEEAETAMICLVRAMGLNHLQVLRALPKLRRTMKGTGRMPKKPSGGFER